MPKFSREETILIEAPPEAVFHYIADLPRHSEWGAHAWDIVPVSETVRGPGATFACTARTGVFGKSITRVISEEPPVRLVYDCLDRSGHHRWTMLLVPDGKGTQLHYRVERLEGPWWMHLFQPILLWPLIGHRDVRTGLANIKAHMERENPPLRS